MAEVTSPLAETIRKAREANASVVESITLPRSQFADIFKEATRTQREITRFADSFRAASMVPRFDTFEKLRGASEEALRIQEQFRTIAESNREMTERIRSLVMPAPEFLDHVRAFRDLIAPPQGTFDAIRKMTDESRAIANLARQVASREHVFDASGLLDTVQRAARMATPDLERIHAAARAAVERSQAKGVPKGAVPKGAAADRDNGSAPVVLPTGIESVDSLPLLSRIFIVFLVLHLLPDVLGSLIAGMALRDAENEPANVVIQQIVNEFGPEPISRLRCVRPKSLRVRIEPNAASAVIGEITTGQTVEVLTRTPEGRWSQVRYLPKGSSEFAVGWVATAFLREINCPE